MGCARSGRGGWLRSERNVTRFVTTGFLVFTVSKQRAPKRSRWPVASGSSRPLREEKSEAHTGKSPLAGGGLCDAAHVRSHLHATRRRFQRTARELQQAAGETVASRARVCNAFQSKKDAECSWRGEQPSTADSEAVARTADVPSLWHPVWPRGERAAADTAGGLSAPLRETRDPPLPAHESSSAPCQRRPRVFRPF